jgi:hypothetical protein
MEYSGTRSREPYMGMLSHAVITRDDGKVGRVRTGVFDAEVGRAGK